MITRGDGVVGRLLLGGNLRAGRRDVEDSALLRRIGGFSVIIFSSCEFTICIGTCWSAATLYVTALPPRLPEADAGGEEGGEATYPPPRFKLPPVVLSAILFLAVGCMETALIVRSSVLAVMTDISFGDGFWWPGLAAWDTFWSDSSCCPTSWDDPL